MRRRCINVLVALMVLLLAAQVGFAAEVTKVVLLPMDFAATKETVGDTVTVTLTWAPAETTESFTIQRVDFVNGTVTLPAIAGTATSYIDKGLAPGNTYFYRIKANTAGGSSPYSPQIAVEAP